MPLIYRLIVVSLMSLALVACGKEEQDREKAGERLDKAYEDVKESTTETGKAIKEGAKDARDKTVEKTKEAGEKISDGAKAVKEKTEETAIDIKEKAE